MVWQASDQKIDFLNAVTGNDPQSRLALAQFLSRQERPEEALGAIKTLDRRSLSELPESGKLLDTLITAGRIDLAAGLWRELFDEGARADRTPVWNGGFETTIRQGFTQFDWKLGETKYARIKIINGTARTGRRSLVVAYEGVNTTRLDREIRQLVLARPGGHYRLACYVKAESLISPDGPQIVVTVPGSETPLASSDVVSGGSYDWRPLTVDFNLPADAQAIFISIKQTPRFSYVEPTKGIVWFDDFALIEQEENTKHAK
jgi:hypothetical protein